MNALKTIKSHITQRFNIILSGSFLIGITALLIFYVAFLTVPKIIISTGLIAVTPLLIFLILSVIIPLVILLYQYPLYGERFFNAIVVPPYTSEDIVSSIELEKNKRFPQRDPHEDDSFSSFLSQQYIEKIVSKIKPEDRLVKKLFPNFSRIVLISLLIIIASLLTILRLNFVSDVIAALRSGLPVELISVEEPIRFKKLNAHIIPPAYIESKTKIITNLVKYSRIKVMKGSRIKIEGELNFINSGRLILSTKRGVEYFPVDIKNGETFRATFLAPNRGAFAMEFTMIKGKKELVRKSRIFRIDTIPDNPPVIEIKSPGKKHNLVYGNPFGILFTAKDDYGLLEITLHHRNSEDGGEYHKELIARFPRKPKKNYSSRHIWNPVVSEGGKINKLLYYPGTKMVEYYIEVRDINVFSSTGVARSDVRYVIFKDVFNSYQNAINIIKRLIIKGKELIQSYSNARKDSYKGEVKEAYKLFTKELKDILPRSTLINETGRIVSELSGWDKERVKSSVEEYILFLERYLSVLKLIVVSQRRDYTVKRAKKLFSNMNRKNMDNLLKKASPIAELIQKEFKDDFNEIKRLLKEGKRAEAKVLSSLLLQKIRKRLTEEMDRYKKELARISNTCSKQMDDLTLMTDRIIKNQKGNRAITLKGKNKKAGGNQKGINNNLGKLFDKIRGMASKNPFVLNSLVIYSRMAKNNGQQALRNLMKSRNSVSSKFQKQVIDNLENFKKQAAKQKEILKKIAKGDLQDIMSQGLYSRFVFIPKEAVYTVPIEFKKKIIEISKKRSKSSKKKEAFWRDLLQ
ncbi:hypothetical protein ACFL20_03595 [Spirochaetota bacterium]